MCQPNLDSLCVISMGLPSGAAESQAQVGWRDHQLLQETAYDLLVQWPLPVLGEGHGLPDQIIWAEQLPRFAEMAG
jgi:hypothetical protein